MLNYIWIGLIALGILAATGYDVADEVKDTYRNGVPLPATVVIRKTPGPIRSTWEGDLVLSVDAYNSFYNQRERGSTITVPVRIDSSLTGAMTFALTLDENAPGLWKVMAKSGGNQGRLTGVVPAMNIETEGVSSTVQLVFDPTGFVKIKAVTQAALDYAATAVNIALGLIGIMALWLGVMKVAEEAGLVRGLTLLLRPITRLLFPEIPPDHPALGAMIMNIAANMLGLSNAATPLGLKAMEELNKLNPKLGTATDAMCTFLAINTGGLILIPATAIAVRVAAGSANPGIIIGTSIFGAACATVAGVAAAKLFARLPRYRKQMEVSNG